MYINGATGFHSDGTLAELSAHSDLQPCTWMTHVLRRCHNLLQDYRRLSAGWDRGSNREQGNTQKWSM